jgi:predicted ribosome quality control (RQC) complex YloA/Tae2 family protein
VPPREIEVPWRPKKVARRVAGENVRRFASAEGYDILVGRDNEQNDRLTLRIANGNDLWLHVGGGRAGSHVVVRLPKGKTASLETLLDAGTLAVHFSKARGERTIDVVYTACKHVRKPKGLPPGAVVPSHTKTITVRLDEARLRRLLDSAAVPED